MDQLFEIRDRLGARAALEHRRDALRRELQSYADACRQMKQACEKEQRDVTLLEEGSFSAAVQKLLGRYEGKLEQAQREAIAARQQYDRAKGALSALEDERLDVEGRLSELDALAKTYAAALAERRQTLRTQMNTEAARRLAALEQARDDFLSQREEIRQALQAARAARETALEARGCLDSADGWATYDVFFKGGILSHMAKYNHVDKAEACFSRLSAQLDELQKELADVHGMGSVRFQGISDGQRVVDFLFDNIFTDLSVRGQIRNNLSDLERVLGSLDALTDTLRRRLDELSRELAKNQAKQEELLLSAPG